LPASTASDPALAIADGRTPALSRSSWRSVAFYLSIGFSAGALIALQLAIMRVFAIGSWAHFGSLVVSLAMLGFGLSSAVICVARPLVERHARTVATAALVLFGPLLAAANLLAQQVPFNAVFLLADPEQKWRLAANFALYLLPFLAGATFLGTVFVQNGDRFSRVYFTDLTGAGLSGIVFMLATYVVPPEDLVAVPLILGLAGAALWIAADGGRAGGTALALSATVSLAVYFALPPALGVTKLAISDYKGVAYARKLPDSQRVLHLLSPFGDLQAYASSYLHFAPGLSDNAAFNLPELPKNAYLGLYLDGEGPVGVIRDLPPEDTAYFAYLPMVYPYLVKSAPEVFVAQFGGGISTALALRSGAHGVTAAESNPVILRAFTEPEFEAFTGHLLQDQRVRVVGNEGRLFLRASGARFDIVDLSLANSAGLSNPGGFSVVERFAYTREAMLTYMRALRPGGVLSVTLWNKEDPPKSVLKLYATMAAAARAFDPSHIADSFYVVGSYLSTTTVLYKNGGFAPAEIAKLREHTDAMSFDDIYYPGIANDRAQLPGLLDAYRNQIFGGEALPQSGPDDPAPAAQDTPTTLPATLLARLVWDHLIRGDWGEIADGYVFDTRPLTDDRPYFAGYVKAKDLPRVVDRLDILQDEWGYLLLWATLGIAAIGALLLTALPFCFGWRLMFQHFPGKPGIILYFGCLGLGYIAVEIALLSKFVLALSNYTISAAVVITSMLTFSGIGSLLAQRFLDRARSVLPQILAVIGALLIAEALWADRALDWIGALSPIGRLLCCVALIFPPSLLMGFPMPIAMTALARLGKDRVFVWAWGINGCFSVVGAALVPIVATSFGLNAVLSIAGGAYLAAVAAVGSLFRRAIPATAQRPA
jgi:spermidine synthase